MTKHSPFRYFKTSPEIIRLAVMLYVRFPLSLRNVEDLLHERGVGAGITRFATVAKYNARRRMTPYDVDPKDGQHMGQKAGACAIAPQQMNAMRGRLKPSRRHRAFDDPTHLRAC